MFRILHEDMDCKFYVAYLKLRRNWAAVFLFAKSGKPACNQNVLVLVAKHSVHERIRKVSVVWVGGRHRSSARCHRMTKLGGVASSLFPEQCVLALSEQIREAGAEGSAPGQGPAT